MSMLTNNRVYMYAGSVGIQCEMLIDPRAFELSITGNPPFLKTTLVETCPLDTPRCSGRNIRGAYILQIPTITLFSLWQLR